MEKITHGGDTTLRFGISEWLLTLGIAVIWGSSSLFAAIALDHVETAVVPAAQLFFGICTLVWFPSARVKIDRADIPRVMLIGFIWMALPFFLYAKAQETTSASVTGMINGGIPVMTVFVTAIFVRSMPTARRMFAVVIGFAGIALVSFSSVGDSATATTQGVMFLLIALVCYAVGTNVIWTLQVKYGALAAIFWGQLFAFVYLLPISIPAISNSEFHWGAVVSLVEMGMFGTGIGYALYGVLVARAGPIRGAIGLFLTPIVATFNGIIFRNDSVRLFAFVGMAIVVVGAVLTSQPESTTTE